MRMKIRIYCFLIATLHTVSWVSGKSKHFAPYNDANHQGQVLQSPQVAFHSKQGLESMEQLNEEEETYKGLSRLGSRPPNCEHKCGGCKPCIAIQVPTTTDQLGLQYANYEPEGWKCKCGTSFFNP